VLSTVPYVPTPEKVVKAMLELAKTKEDDVVYDMGCGDGRIVITAVKEFNAKKAVCVEINDERIKETTSNIDKNGVTGNVET